MPSDANPFEISDIERMNIGAHRTSQEGALLGSLDKREMPPRKEQQ